MVVEGSPTDRALEFVINFDTLPGRALAAAAPQHGGVTLPKHRFNTLRVQALAAVCRPALRCELIGVALTAIFWIWLTTRSTNVRV